jgi:hypothetical protein
MKLHRHQTTHRYHAAPARSAIFGFAISLLALPLGDVHAQLEGLSAAGTRSEPIVRIGFGGGMSVPRTGMRDAFRSGINGEGFLLLRLPGGLPTLRIALDYQKFDVKEAARTLAGGSAGTQVENGQTEVLGGVGGFRMDLLRGPVRPYVMAGVGAFNVRSAIALAGGGSESSAETNIGVDGGAGIALRLGRIDAFIEARMQNVYTNKGFIDTKSIQTIPVTFGILF